MKLLSVYIEDYKNIKNQTFDFSANTGYIALIGENGSGKSNLLEAISLIFNGIFNKKEIPFNYTIEYKIGNDTYKRGKRLANKNNIKIKEMDMKYPSSVIACYSGEDLRLWHKAYKDYHMRFFNNAIKNKLYAPQLLYVNKYCWTIALIALLCEEKAKSFLENCLNITDITSVTISFEYDSKKSTSFNKHDALKWFNRIVKNGNSVNAKTLATTDINFYSALTQRPNVSKTVFQYLFLLYLSEKNKINKVDKLISNITIKLGDIDFDDLSEGEKKLILIECITKILGDEDSLLLLDEPDAHTHIARKDELRKAIESFNGQTIMTTHSPVFVDLLNNIYFINHGKTEDIEKAKLVSNLSDGHISILEGTLLFTYKKLIVTEGPEDIKHLKAAIDYFANKDDKYKPLMNVSIIMQGGAKLVNDCYGSILSKIEDIVDKVIFVFDYDSEGREGAKMVKGLQKTEKITYCFYNSKYPIKLSENRGLNFYLEDFYSDDIYSDVDIPKIEGKPKYCEIKKLNKLAESVKNRIKYKMDLKKIKDADFDGFEPFLDELLKLFK